MPEVQYGDKIIEYAFQEKSGLKSHYITVEKNQGVVLKGKSVPEETANKFILKKAKWILDKLRLVETIEEGDIVTGSRIQYLGKKYYAEVYFDDRVTSTTVEFNHSRFKIITNSNNGNVQSQITTALDKFFLEKSSEKIPPRVKKWAKKTGFTYRLLQFRKQDKRWGSCTPQNNIIINTEAIKLPYTLIDYLIVHELCHTRYKNHSKGFWAEVSNHLHNWKELDERMGGMRM